MLVRFGFDESGRALFRFYSLDNNPLRNASVKGLAKDDGPPDLQPHETGIVAHLELRLH